MKNSLNEDLKRIHTLTYGSHKKVKIIESQENPEFDKKYESTCNFEFNYPHHFSKSDAITYKGNEVDSFSCGDYMLEFKIEIIHSDNGIFTINPYDIKGDDTIEVEVTFFNGSDENSDTLEEYIDLKIDWDNAYFEMESPTDSEHPKIGINNTIQIDLVNDSEGNIIAEKISGYKYGIS